MKAFWLALRWLPDLVITDYNMDEGNGRYLLGRLKSTPATAHIPVVVFTATAFTQGELHPIRRELLGSGAAEFLPKSPSVEVLIATVRKHIKGLKRSAFMAAS